MTYFFVNLKRFDVPASLGGVCPVPDPLDWIESVAKELEDVPFLHADSALVFLLPESLVIPFRRALASWADSGDSPVGVGVQSVFRSDVSPGGNFGAFTSNLPAAAALAAGATWALVGHSEERLDKSELMQMVYAGSGPSDTRVSTAVGEVIAREAVAAARRGLNVLACVGETAEERGEGTAEVIQQRVRAVLTDQLKSLSRAWRDLDHPTELVIGYEPRWAIGPGKTPPGSEYIGFVAEHIQETLSGLLGERPPVVYGGGLKTANAAEISGIPSVSGGLIALTQFTGEIGFTVGGLREIVKTYYGSNA